MFISKSVIKAYMIVIFIMTLAIMYLSMRVEPPEVVEDSAFLRELQLANGSPVRVSYDKFGDGVEVNETGTYCQLLPYKRYVGDNQVHCFTIEE